MCFGTSLKKLLVFCFVILAASSALFAFGWDRPRATATAVTTPTVAEAPASEAPAPAYSAPSLEVAPAAQQELLMPAIAESKRESSTPSVENALIIMDSLLNELENSKRASKEAQATLTGLQNALSSANASYEAYKAEAAQVMEEKKALANEVNRLHLGLGVGATFAPFEDMKNFGTEVDLTLRKGSLMLLAGVEYPDMMNVLDFDYTKLRFKGTVLFEF